MLFVLLTLYIVANDDVEAASEHSTILACDIDFIDVINSILWTSNSVF